MKAVVTGISGFVGSHLAEHLQAAGDAVLGIVRPPAPVGNTAVHDAADGRLGWDVGDAAPTTTLEQIALFKPDVIYHLAAMSIPRLCGETQPTPAAIRANVDGVRNVLELAATLPRSPRVVFTSSSRVYAPVDCGDPFVAESSRLDPQTGYGRTKLVAEQLCRDAAVRHGLDVVVVRSFTQSGPRMDSRLMLAEWARQFLSPDAMQIEVASLDATIDFLDVRDGVRALRLLAEHGVAGETYNVGSGVPRTTREVFDMLRAAFDDRRPVRELRPGRRCDPIADVTKLQSAAAWSPYIAAAQTVADVVAELRRSTG